MRLTREDEAHNEPLTTSWASHTFSKPVRKLYMFSVGDLADAPTAEIRINDSSTTFLLGNVHNFRIINHVVTKVEWRRVSGTNGEISILGLRDGPKSEGV